MKINDLDDILLVNWYLVKCKFEDKCIKKTHLFRNYLTHKINTRLYYNHSFLSQEDRDRITSNSNRRSI